MELALSLGDTPKPFSYLDKSQKIVGIDLGFCMAAGKSQNNGGAAKGTFCTQSETRERGSDPPVQLDLLPFSPLHTTNHQPPSSNKFPFPWLTNNLSGEAGRGLLEVKLRRVEEGEEGTAVSSPNSAVSSFHQMDHFSIFKSNKRDFDLITGTAANNELGDSTADRGGSNSNSRGISDEEENGMARKKLRLSKEQSAFLEDSFKEHNTLNPKQKLALAKELNLRPRQVEVWFQNRRARTKLKQTEVDCEYLKRCCEKLTEENRRLQKELQELRALKASQPFYNHLPATTLTMCPSCERVVTTASSTPPSNKPSKLFSLSPPNAHLQQAAS